MVTEEEQWGLFNLIKEHAIEGTHGNVQDMTTNTALYRATYLKETSKLGRFVFTAIGFYQH